MDEYASESDSDYTSYWRDWVSRFCCLHLFICSWSLPIHPICCYGAQYSSAGVGAGGRLLVHGWERRYRERGFHCDTKTTKKKSSDQRKANALPYAQFISSRGNEYFCEIDEDYLTDRFNLTGLNTEVQYYQYALDLVTDVFDLDCDDDMRETIESSARHLYGLVHARYIVTTRGLTKMVLFPSPPSPSSPPIPPFQSSFWGPLDRLFFKSRRC